MTPTLIAAAAAVLAAAGACDVAPTARPAFDATRIKPGTFTYAYSIGGKARGRFVIRVQRVAGQWRFSGDGGGEHWESLATADLRPISATLSARRDGHPYRMDLVYAPASVRSIETIDDIAGQPKETALPPWIVDQRVDWAAVMSAGLRPAQGVSFAVFDPATGVSTVSAVAGERKAVPGLTTFSRLDRVDYRVCKNGVEEKYAVISTLHAPKVLVREYLREDEVDTLVGLPASVSSMTRHSKRS